MAKKGKKSKVAPFEDEIEQSLPEDVQQVDTRPVTSQYARPAFELRIGSRDYTVPDFLLEQCPKICKPPSPYFGKTIELPEVDEDIGHTLVHYLYHGTYQTLRLQDATGVDDSEVEYRRGVLTYATAWLYEIDGLTKHALDAMIRYGKGLSVAQILDCTCDVYAKLPDDEVWLPKYLKTRLEMAFHLDQSCFSRGDFLEHIGRNPAFSKALVKIMTDIYASKLTSRIMPSRSRIHHQESGEHAATNWQEPQEEGALEDYPVGDDFECLSSPPLPSTVDNVYVHTEECPSLPSLLKEELIPDGSYEQHSTNATTPADEDVPPLSVLDGLRCESNGSIKDYTGKVIGEITEGDAIEFSQRMYFCDGNGNIRDYKNKSVGKCKTLISSKREGVNLYNRPEVERIEISDVCPEQVQHMRNGGVWKTCQRCRSLVRQMSIQLLHEGKMTDRNGMAVEKEDL